MLSSFVSALLVASTLAVPLTLRPSSSQTGNAQTAPFSLNIRNPNRQTFAPEYLVSTGLTAPTADSATSFQLTGYGGLSTASTPDNFAILYLGQGQDDPVQQWYMSPSLVGVYTGLSLETTNDGEILRWEDKRFENGKASFCQSGSVIEVMFWGPPPDDCEPVDLVAIRVK